MRVTTTLIAALTLAGCASSWQKMEGNFQLETTPPLSVIEVAKAPQAKGPFPTWEFQRVDRFQGNGSLGMTMEIHSKVTLRQGEGGLTQALIWRTWGDAKSAQRGTQEVRELSLCGLEVLSKEAVAGVVLPEFTPSVMVGGTTFMSAPRRAQASNTERRVVDSLSLSAAGVCTPKAATEYSYEIAHRHQNRWSEKQNLLMPLASSTKCRTADAKITAASIAPGLEGEALEIKCVATYKTEGTRPSRHAFIESLGAFLPLEIDEPERGTTQFQYIKAGRGSGG